jgi:hypothetical protein
MSLVFGQVSLWEACGEKDPIWNVDFYFLGASAFAPSSSWAALMASFPRTVAANVTEQIFALCPRCLRVFSVVLLSCGFPIKQVLREAANPRKGV